jgi:hypothetical protein
MENQIKNTPENWKLYYNDDGKKEKILLILFIKVLLSKYRSTILA